MSITVQSIARYPVKGLSPESVQTARLTPGEGLAGDRGYALILDSADFNPAAPKWLPKSNFLMLAKYPRLAMLSTRLEDGTSTLIITRDGKWVAEGDLSDPVGRAVIEDFFDAYMKQEIDDTARVVFAPGHMFSDHRNKVLSIINRASLKDLERATEMTLDPLRFRANLLIDGAEPWDEFNWVDKEITIGETRLKVTQRIDRCPATSANPDTGEIDINIPRALRKTYRHIYFGVYAKVLEGGDISPADPITVL